MAISNDREVLTATIDAAGSLSAAVDLGGKSVVGIMAGSTFDANTAFLGFSVSADGTTYELLRDNAGALVQLAVLPTNTNKATHMDHTKFYPWSSIKVGTYKADTTTAQTQTAETEIGLVVAKTTG